MVRGRDFAVPHIWIRALPPMLNLLSKGLGLLTSYICVSEFSSVTQKTASHGSIRELIYRKRPAEPVVDEKEQKEWREGRRGQGAASRS